MQNHVLPGECARLERRPRYGLKKKTFTSMHVQNTSKSTRMSAAVGAASQGKCPPGQHATPVVTYILQSSSATLVALKDGYKGWKGEFASLKMAPDTLPLTIPYLTNQIGKGKLFEDVLNTTQFLDDWAALSEKADPSQSQFAMPGQAVSNQCYKQYHNESTEVEMDIVPSNALVRINADPSKAILVDIFDVSVAEDGSYVFILRQAPEYSEIMVPEGQCHAWQSLILPHYHHTSKCMDIILDWNVEKSMVTGQGITMFMKQLIWPF